MRTVTHSAASPRRKKYDRVSRFFGRKAKYLTQLQVRLDVPKRDSLQFYLDLKESNLTSTKVTRSNKNMSSSSSIIIFF